MAKQRVFKTIRKKTQRLLEGQEDLEVDFKKTADIDVEDIVSFANSPSGGTLLLGVDEKDGVNKVVGCSVSDTTKVSLENKAADCYPAVKIEIFIENTNRKPIYRVDIPPSPNRPHCTKRGVYKIRGDGRNNLLTPEALLTMFLSSEEERFISRFEKATAELGNVLDSLGESVGEKVDDVLFKVEGVEDKLQRSIDDILTNIEMMISYTQSTLAGIVEDLSGERGGQIEEAFMRIEGLDEQLNHIFYETRTVLQILKAHFR